MKNKLPSGWREVELGEICEIVMGQSPPGNSYNDKQMGIPFFQGKAEFGKRYPEVKKWTTNPSKLAKSNDILMSVRAPVGSVNISNIDCCIGRGLAVLRAKGALDYLYLFHILQFKEKEICNLGSGSTFKAINSKQLISIKIPLPPISTQQKIVSILEKAEQAKEWRKEADKLTNEYLKSVFVEMFGDPALNSKSWPIKELEELCIKITDGEHLNPQLENQGKHLIMAKDVQEDNVDFSQNNFVSAKNFQKYTKKCNPENGDLLLVSRGATIGRCTSVKTTTPFCLMGSVILIKPKGVDVKFLEFLFRDSNFVKKVVKVSGASAQQAIYLLNLKKLSILNPPIPLQQKFASIVKEVEQLKEHQNQSKEQLYNLFNSLMQKAFKGELHA